MICLDELYLVLCTNDETDEQRAFCAFRRSDAETIKISFLQFCVHPEAWNVVIIRSIEE